MMKNDHSWRGMLIKDNEGDWGICVATWRGMTKGKPGVPGTYGFLMPKGILGCSHLFEAAPCVKASFKEWPVHKGLGKMNTRLGLGSTLNSDPSLITAKLQSPRDSSQLNKV